MSDEDFLSAMMGDVSNLMVQPKGDIGSTSAHVAMKPTDEQQQCIDAFLTGENLVVRALSGTGKSSTLKMMAQNSTRKGVYLAFNKKTADEASLSFPNSAVCKTVHSVAYWAISRRWGPALKTRLAAPRLSIGKQMSILKIQDEDWLELNGDLRFSPSTLVRLAMDTVQNFCYSGDELPNSKHVPNVPKIDSWDDQDRLADVIVPLALRAWADLSNKSGKLKLSHDAYLKLYSLSNPTLPFDYILVDEFQDTNSCVLGLLKSQKCQLIGVGDSYQSLYQWRNSIDALDKIDAKHEAVLTGTWRFGQIVADEGNKWLDLLGSKIKINCSNPDKVSHLGNLQSDATAVLCRTNGSAVVEVMAAAMQNRRVALVGGTDQIVSFANAASDLQTKGKTSHHELFPFKSWNEVQQYVAEGHAKELKVLVKMVDKYGPNGIINVMKSCTNFGLWGPDAASAERQADVLVSTVHKFKGMESKKVRICSDFEMMAPDEDNPEILRTEMMLAYVAVTRAMDVLDLGGLEWINDYIAEQTN